MQLHWIDWAIVLIVLVFTTAIAFGTKRYTKSVADFLAANRCAGRYLLAIAGGVAGNGAISIIAYFQIYYQAGFTPVWWDSLALPIGLVIAMTGWVVYRYRETRALTLAQFFEIRYSRNFRVFAGLLSFTGGIINFGIFPSVGARFFIYFCGFPETLMVGSLEISTFAVVMIILLSIALVFTFLGGQIAVIVTDFVQGAFSNIVFGTITIFLLCMFDWSEIVAGLKFSPPEASMFHPFHTSETQDFNMWYYAIMAFASFYNTISWQGSQAYDCSAKSAHEAKMARILGTWRTVIMTVFIVFIPICAYAIMHNPVFSTIAEDVNASLGTIENEKIYNQMVVPSVLRQVLPVGLIGVFCAVMLAAFISTHDTYLHSWGSILFQDVILPFRKKPFASRQHIWLLRLSMFAVAVFIFFFSLFFRHTSHIVLFLHITGAIFMGGAGSVIIGGLYWKNGTTAAAWSSMIVGSALAVSGLIIHQIIDDFPINEMVINFIAMTCSILTYIVVSFFTKGQEFNIEKMLHRGKYAIREASGELSSIPARGFRAIITQHFTLQDKIIYASVLIWILGLWTIFLIGTILNIIHDVKVEAWIVYWHIYLYAMLIMGIGATVWLTVGGFIDLGKMFKVLSTAKRNVMDDGTIVGQHIRGEEIANVKENGNRL